MTALATHSMHPLLACVEGVLGAVAAVRDLQPTFLRASDKESAVLALERARSALLELELRVLATADAVAAEHGARDVAAWLRQATRSDGPAARGLASLAAAVDSRWARVGAGLAEGEVSEAQAHVIVSALDDLPETVSGDVKDMAEQKLVELAATFRPSELRRLGRRILDVVAPEVAEEEEAKRLVAEDSAAEKSMRLTARDLGNGTHRLSGVLPSHGAARLLTYLDAFTSPRHQQDGAPVDGPGEVDLVPLPRRRAHAFMALLERLDPARLPEHGGDATTVIVTIGLDQLRADLGAAGILDGDLDAGANLSAAQARRLACTAHVLPAVLGGESEILDLGRSRRLFSRGLRRALRLRDKRCRAEGCTIPAAWCEAHHLAPWALGGTTDLANGILLCSWHHHRAHDPAMALDRLPNGDVRFHRRR